MKDRGLGVFALYLRVMRKARPFWGQTCLLVLVSLAATPLALLTPLGVKIVVDSVIGHHRAPGFIDLLAPGRPSDTTVLVFAAVLFILVQVLIYVRSLAEWVLTTSVGERFVLRFREELFRHVQRLSLAYHDTRGTTDSTYRIQYDVQAISAMVVSVPPVLTAMLTLAGMVYVIARIDSALAVVAVLVAPALLWVIRRYGRRMRAGWSKTKEYESSAMSVVQEALGAMRVVKAFGQEEREQERFVHHSTKNVQGQVRLAVLGGTFDLMVGLVLAVGGGVVLLIGAQHVRSGSLTTGDLILVMAYLTQLYQPLQIISKQFGNLQNSVASAERVFTVLDEATEVDERPDARPLERAGGRIAFRGVSFGYDDRTVLQEVTFDVAPGTRVGIAGVTGAGKTTLVNLLSRFYDPTEGAISLDGVDLRDYRLRDLRNQFAIVLQEPVLFSTSIAQNIGFARPSATQKEIEAAAMAAGAHQFITALPDGYDTEVGERGMRLSGGERQRISLARAFLKDAPILILDEPTSSVDMRTEAEIMESMSLLMRGRTSFMIAHRTSTLERCDVLLTIEHGRLASLAIDVPNALAQAGDGSSGDGFRPERPDDSVIRAEGDAPIEEAARALGDADPRASGLARLRLGTFDQAEVARWVRSSLREADLERAELAAAVAEVLTMYGATADILERAARAEPERRRPFVAALTAFGLDPDSLVEILSTTPAAIRTRCLLVLWEVCGRRLGPALQRRGLPLSAEDLATLRDLYQGTGDQAPTHPGSTVPA